MTINNWQKSMTSLLCLLCVSLFAQTTSAQTWDGSTTSGNDAWRTGNVGLGTSSPASQLDISGVTTLRGNVDLIGDQYFNLAGNSSKGHIRFYDNGSGTNERIVIDGGASGLKLESDLVFKNHKYIRNQDQEPVLWIRTTDIDGFDSPLNVFKSIRIATPADDALFSQEGLGLRIDSDGNGTNEAFSFKTGTAGVELLKIQQDGKVGIGTSTPGYELDVAGNINASDLLINGQSIGTNFTGTNATLTDLHVTNVLEVGPNSINIGVVTQGGNLLENHIWTTPPSGQFTGSTLYIQDGAATGSLASYNTVMNANGNYGRVGIGAGQPQAKLHLNYETNIPGIMMERDQAGTIWEDTKVLIGVSSNSSQHGLRFELSDDDGANYQDVLFLGDDGHVGIGTTAPANALDVCGTIRAKEIKVKAGWCDYVFEEDYQLRPLEEVEAFILENKHLPNIPTAMTVENEGLELGDMQTRMMEKIEELTLYTISLNKQVKALEAQLEAVQTNK